MAFFPGHAWNYIHGNYIHVPLQNVMWVIKRRTHRTKGGRGGLVLCAIIVLLTVAYLEFVIAVSHWLIFIMQASTCLFFSLSATMATWIESNDKDGSNCKTNFYYITYSVHLLHHVQCTFTTSHTVYIYYITYSGHLLHHVQCTFTTSHTVYICISIVLQYLKHCSTQLSLTLSSP